MILNVLSHHLANKEVMPTVPKSEDMCGRGCTGDMRCPSNGTAILKTNHQQIEVLKRRKLPMVFLSHTTSTFSVYFH
jgi:hypothetical protein